VAVTHVAGARADLNDGLDRVQARRRRLSEVFEHHRSGPYLADWVGDALARDVRSGAVDGF
jgi:hypothetical protein